MDPHSPQPKDRLTRLEDRLGYTFQDRSLLLEALTHASTRLEGQRTNERLEFLGDAVLGLVVSEVLFRENPHLPEGRLSSLRTQAVSGRRLAAVGESLGLLEFVTVGKGFPPAALQSPRLAGALVEAILGAVFLDGGMEAARGFVAAHVLAPRWPDEPEPPVSYKNLLQHHVQKLTGRHPFYEMVPGVGTGPGALFTARVTVGDRTFPPASGRTKKEAEQEAAFKALEILQREQGAGGD